MLRLGEARPKSFVIADFNKDGLNDVAEIDSLAALQPGAIVSITPSWGFFARNAVPGAVGLVGGIAAADINSDGKLDLVMSEHDTGKMRVHPGNGNGSFGNPAIYDGMPQNQAVDVAVADFNGDGWPDVALNNRGGIKIFHFNNQGAVSSTRVLSSPQLGEIKVMRVADFDGDGAPDIFFGGMGGAEPMILTGLRNAAPDLHRIGNTGLGTVSGGAAADVLGNGRASLAIFDYPGGKLTFLPAPLVSGSQRILSTGVDFPRDAAFADMNRDGKLDLVLASALNANIFSDAVLRIFRNGTTGFEANPAVISLGQGRMNVSLDIMAAGDIDGDGGADLLISSPNWDGGRLFYNTSPGAPAFTSQGTSGIATAGSFATFGFKGTGNPRPTFTTASPLPAGMTLNSNGTLSGTPAAGTARTYPLVITASNGVLPNATQNFTLTVVSSLPGLSNLTPENIRSSTISLRGYLDTSGTSPVTRRGFVWSLTSTDSTPQLGEPGVFFVDVPVDTLQGFSAALTGLAPSSDYTYATFAVNSSGTAYAPVSTFQTLPPPGAGSLVVTTAVDEDNGNSDPNNGTGTSLREAINYANLLGADATITFSPNLFFSGPATLQVTLGQITLNNVGGTTTINGPGAHLLTINGAANGSQRMLRTVTGYTVINGVTFANGLSSNDGSAIQAGGTVVLNDCVFRNNASPLSRGGALSVSGETRIYRCTFQGNSSGHGGAIAVEGNLLLIQCTLHGNSAVTGDGGALYSPFTANQIRVVHSTFTGNSATGTGGAIFSSGDRLRVFNSILSGNTAPTGPNVQGPLRENVGNLIDADAANIFVTGLPASLGGSTPTIALNPGGLAINAGSNAQSVNWTGVFGQTANPLTTDQRGRPRAIGGTVDVGATELPGLPTVTAPTVSGLTANSAVLGGNVTADGSGPLSLRGIVFARTADNPNPARGALGVTEIIASGNTGIFTVNASGLSATTGYSFAAFAVNEAGAAYSSVATFDTGTVDSDGDMLTDNQEVTLGSNRFSLDSDGDGFNDATEYLNGSDPTSAASMPGTTRIERVFGSGAARGLDLSGNFVYAFNVGPAGPAGQAGDANFTADNAPGITVHGPNNPIANWNNPSFGATAADNVLETVYQSIRWTDRNWSAPDRNLRVDLANLTVGRRYKLQLLFGEAGQTGRRFDVLLNGSLLANDFAPADAQGSASMTTAGSAVVHEFTATSTTLNIVLDGSDVAAVPFLSNDPYLNGVTLEHLPSAPVAGADGLNRPNTTTVAKVLKSVLLGNDSDADSDPLTLTAVGNAQPAGATVVLAGNFVVYTAPANNAGNGSFTYTLSAGAHSVTGTVTVTETSTAGGGGGTPNYLTLVPSGNDFVVTFLGVPGGSFRVQYSTSTAPPYVWTEFAPQAIYTAAPNGVFTHTDVNPPGPVRFYRAVSNP